MAITIKGTDNSASLPAYTGSDPDTGMFFPAADTIAFAEGGTEVMRIDSSGQVGLGFIPNAGQGTLQTVRVISGGAPVTSGTSDPNQAAMLGAGAVQLSYGAYPAGTGWLQMRASGSFALNYDLALLPNGGNLGIGTSSPSGRFHVRQDQDGVTRSILHNRNASGTPIVELDFITGAVDLSDSRYAYIQSGGGSSQYIAFGTGQGASPTERMRIDSAGRVTMPYQTAFYAYGGSTQSFSGAQTSTVFQLNTQDSLGSRSTGYNTSTYRFTAPVAGAYFFAARMVNTTSNATGPELIFRKNGSTSWYGAINYISNSYATTSGQVIIYLSASDYVDVVIVNNNSTTFTLDTTRSNFMGYLIG